jgi:uncharacterized membrane protein
LYKCFLKNQFSLLVKILILSFLFSIPALPTIEATHQFTNTSHKKLETLSLFFSANSTSQKSINKKSPLLEWSFLTFKISNFAVLTIRNLNTDSSLNGIHYFLSSHSPRAPPIRS